MGYREDEIAGADVARTQRKLDGIRSAADTDGVPNTNKISERGFEPLDLSTQDIEPAFENTGDRGVDRSALREIAGTRISLGDRGRKVFRCHGIDYR